VADESETWEKDWVQDPDEDITRYHSRTKVRERMKLLREIVEYEHRVRWSTWGR
jgi:hypothetical protein